MDKHVKNICIVGGGTAGWMAATLLSTVAQSAGIRVTLVESLNIEPIGVGESTVPSMLDFIRASQINLKEFVQATSATFKLGIKFVDWHLKGSHFFHPFGRIGNTLNGFDFYQTWLQTQQKSESTSWLAHSPCAEMAKNGRFILPPAKPKNWLEGSIAHALHIDATLMANYLRNVAKERGVNHIEGTVEHVLKDDSELICSLILADGKQINADFFIDCTGFKGLLIDKHYEVGYEDWSHYLPCDRAVVVQTENESTPPPFTVAKAQTAGWSWSIPLQHRVGNGYVFPSHFVDDSESIDTLLSQISGKRVNDPRFLSFKTGKRNQIWSKNCLALGLSAGFVEPLESTAIHLIYKTLVHFIEHFPRKPFEPDNEAAFNRKMDADYYEVRDFIILHYCTSNRDDSDFWRWCNTMPVPDSLTEKIELFKQRGALTESGKPLFTKDSWFSILEGMHIRPETGHPLMNGFDQDRLASMLRENATVIAKSVVNMPRHDEFIRQHCLAPK